MFGNYMHVDLRDLYFSTYRYRFLLTSSMETFILIDNKESKLSCNVISDIES